MGYLLYSVQVETTLAYSTRLCEKCAPTGWLFIALYDSVVAERASEAR